MNFYFLSHRRAFDLDFAPVFRDVTYGEPRDNCELSDHDTQALDAANPAHFDNTANDYDFYERALGRMADDCLDGKNGSIKCIEDDNGFAYLKVFSFICSVSSMQRRWYGVHAQIARRILR